MGRRKRIAVLVHEREVHVDPALYLVHNLAEFWREDGYEVVRLFGPERVVPADLLLVHVDLSVVPESYLEFAACYPVVLNSRVRDIRKSVTSRNIVSPGDGWDGPVIVKSDRNCGGAPERDLEATNPARRRLLRVPGRTPENNREGSSHLDLAGLPGVRPCDGRAGRVARRS